MSRRPPETDSDEDEEVLQRRACSLKDRLYYYEENPDLLPGYEGLGDASGLDTTLDMDIGTSSGLSVPDVTSYHVVVKKAAELLELPLVTKEVKSNLLTEILHHSSQSPEPVLPFHQAL